MSDRPLEFIFGVNDENPIDVTWGPYMYAGLDYRPARKRIDLISAEDSDGAAVLGVAKADTMNMALRLRIDDGASMDAALDQLHRLQQKIDDAAKRGSEGLECAWRPEGASERSYFFLLEGEIAEVPQEMSGADVGWYHKSPIVVVTMVCKPFFYGDWSTPVVASGTTPVIEAELENVPGDVDAEGEMTITDVEGQDRRHLEWGLEQFGYNAAAPEDILLNLASGMTLTGYSGASTTRSLSYSANVAVGRLTPTWSSIWGTSGQAHVGRKRIKVRCLGGAVGVQLRIAWRVADGQLSYGEAVELPDARVGEWVEADLGVVNISEATDGTHSWTAEIQGLNGGDSATSDVYLDYVEVIPAERAATLTAAEPDDPAPFRVIAYDTFATASGATTGDVATDGRTWASMGGLTDGDDFQAGAGDTIERTATSDNAADARYGRGILLGAEEPAGVDAYLSVDLNAATAFASSRFGILARFVDNSNWLAGVVHPAGTGLLSVGLYSCVSGSINTLDLAASQAIDPTATNRIRLKVLENGRYFMYVNDELYHEGYNSTLKRGNALASGQVGILDYHPSASALTRSYSDFQAVELRAYDRVCFANQDLIVAHDRAVRFNSGGTQSAPVERNRGSRLFIPPAGDQGKATRLVSKLRRNDVTTEEDRVVDDEHEMSIRYRPRYRNPIGTT